MKASDLLVRCLEREGITHIFGVPAPVLRSALDHKKPSLLTIPIDYRENVLLSERLGRLQRTL